MVRRGAIAAVCAGIALASAAVARGATIGVNTAADQFGGGAKCALREALEAARLDAGFGGCRSGTGSDVVLVRGGRTYELTRPSTTPPTLGRGGASLFGDVALRPRGRGRATIDGGGANDAILYVVGSDNVISRVRVRGGHNDIQGGGIQVTGAAELDVHRSMISGNRSDLDGGGIANFGNLDVRDSTISGNRASNYQGGGIYHYPSGQLTIVDSTISGNSARGTIGSGGGLAVVGGSAVAINSTLSGNRANGGGGGIWVSGAGSSLTLFNATVTDNTADADGVSGGSGGGIARTEGSVTAINTIIGGNSAGGGTAPDCAGEVSLTYSLLGNATGCSGFFPTDNVLGEPPRLRPLAGNGGETKTHLLRRGSDARNSGNPAQPGSTLIACLRRDQRGVRRPQQGRCDMGSTEFKPRRR